MAWQVVTFLQIYAIGFFTNIMAILCSQLSQLSVVSCQLVRFVPTGQVE